jgi:hypothetical protein
MQQVEDAQVQLLLQKEVRQLLRAGPDLLCSGSRPDLLRPGHEVLRSGRSELLRPGRPELLRPEELLHARSQVLRSGRPELLRSPRELLQLTACDFRVA